MNVLLFRKRGRLAYLVNSTIEKELVLFKAVLHAMPELAGLSASPYKLLLVRKENKVQVETMLREGVADSHLALAKVLGYAYQGADWRSGDRYAITYHFRYQGIKNRLLTFMVPVPVTMKPVALELKRAFCASILFSGVMTLSFTPEVNSFSALGSDFHQLVKK